MAKKQRNNSSSSTINNASPLATNALANKPLPDPMDAIKKENQELKAALAQERAKMQELSTEKALLSAEVEDLTRTLFEEANGMVATEAQARFAVEQAQKRLESELAKTLEMLSLESEQTKFLRELVEQERTTQRQQDPFLWDIDVFGARLKHDFYDDFYPQRTFNSRERSASREWDALSRTTCDTWQYKQFASFVDECVRIGQKGKDDEALLGVLGHAFMRSCLGGDVEPCLTFPVLERAGRTKSLLKKLLPAMLKNTCLIEPLAGASTLTSLESQRASPVGSIKSFLSVAPSREGSPIKNEIIRETTSSVESTIDTVAIDIPLTTTSSQAKSKPPKSSPTNTNNNSFLTRFDSYLNSLVGSNPESYLVTDIFGTSPTSDPSSAIMQSSTMTCHKCAFCDQSEPSYAPAFRFRINLTPDTSPSKSSPSWTLLCRGCRDRLVAVASFFTILRHLLRGLQSHRPKIDIYFDVLQAKRFMFYARSGALMDFYALSDFEAFSQKLQ